MVVLLFLPFHWFWIVPLATTFTLSFHLSLTLKTLIWAAFRSVLNSILPCVEGPAIGPGYLYSSEKGFVLTAGRHKRTPTDTDLCWRAPRWRGKVTAAFGLLGRQSSKASPPVCLPSHLLPFYYILVHMFEKSCISNKDCCVFTEELDKAGD